ncbi:MAG: hypothetical protein J5778_06220 [Clostridiales bacterium]|nr:hypothetical protein [Clostridiales bacterium]
MNYGDVVFDPLKDKGIISDKDRIKERFPDKDLVITKKFLDARHGKLKLCYRVEDFDPSMQDLKIRSMEKEAMPYLNELDEESKSRYPSPVIIGFGPAGMFAALILARYGFDPIVIERGRKVDDRIRDCEDYRRGIRGLDINSNILFGEGGAGTFSDGKLYTGIGSGLIGFVNRTFYRHGAPYEICYSSHPHIGTDNLRKIVSSIRSEIEALGGKILFDTEFTGLKMNNGQIGSVVCMSKEGEIEIPACGVILGIGHSATDTMRKLYADGIAMESKSFSVGVRIEHLRRNIDIARYGVDSAELYNIGAADYKLAVDTASGRKLYTFCMCPGGEVVASSAFPGHIVTNGMSYHARDFDNSNSALLVPVTMEDFGEGVFDGLKFRELLETKAFELAGSNDNAPCMTYGDLASGKVTEHNDPALIPSYKPGVTNCDLRELFPQFITDTLIDGIRLMGKKIKGFDSPDAVLTAPETGSSSPVRILRDKETFMSISCRGLFPAGEGAGYAGGIVSSAVDGINCANAYVRSVGLKVYNYKS